MYMAKAILNALNGNYKMLCTKKSITVVPTA